MFNFGLKSDLSQTAHHPWSHIAKWSAGMERIMIAEYITELILFRFKHLQGIEDDVIWNTDAYLSFILQMDKIAARFPLLL